MTASRFTAPKTHRLPDIYLTKYYLEELVRHVVDVTLMSPDNPSFHPLSLELGGRLCTILNEINNYKPRKNFNPTNAVPMYQLELRTKRMVRDLECDIIFSTDWKFFTSHQPACEYRYAVKVKLAS